MKLAGADAANTGQPPLLPSAMSHVSYKKLTDAELSQHIADCGLLMIAAMSAGNREEAMGWWQAQLLAINNRSPAQKARMTKAIHKRLIDEGSDYFQVGALQHPALKR